MNTPKIQKTFVDFLPELYRITDRSEGVLEFERETRSVFEQIGPSELAAGYSALRLLLEEMDGQIRRWEDEKGENDG